MNSFYRQPARNTLSRQKNPNRANSGFGTETETGFIASFSERQYEIKGIQRADTQLKVTIKASADVAKNLPFELSTIDLYSSRSRHWFAKLCAALFGAKEALVKEDIGKDPSPGRKLQAPRKKKPQATSPPRRKKPKPCGF